MNRIEEIDILKGFAIICVIIGHSHINNFFDIGIYTWHMPLFFVLSGYFFNNQIVAGGGLSVLAKKLLIPYYFTVIVCILLNWLNKCLTVDDVYALFLGSVRFGSSQLIVPQINGNCGATWFLYCLFMCKIIYSVLIKYIKNTHLITVITLFTYLGAYGLSKYINLPFMILQAFHCLVYYHIGFLFKKLDLFRRIKDISTAWIVIPILVLIVVFYYNDNYSVVYLVSSHKGLVLNLIGTVCMTAVLYRMAYSFKNYLFFLEYCGRISLIILCIHTIDLYCGISASLSNGSLMVLTVLRLLSVPLAFCWDRINRLQKENVINV